MYREAVNLEMNHIRDLNHVIKGIDSEDHLQKIIFSKSRDEHEKIIFIENLGLDNNINIYAPNLTEHLDYISRKAHKWRIKRQIYIDEFELDYLSTRSWFMKDRFLQMKVFYVIEKGHLDKINQSCGDFEDHLDEIIRDHIK